MGMRYQQQQQQQYRAAAAAAAAAGAGGAGGAPPTTAAQAFASYGVTPMTAGGGVIAGHPAAAYTLASQGYPGSSTPQYVMYVSNPAMGGAYTTHPVVATTQQPGAAYAQAAAYTLMQHGGAGGAAGAQLMMSPSALGYPATAATTAAEMHMYRTTAAAHRAQQQHHHQQQQQQQQQAAQVAVAQAAQAAQLAQQQQQQQQAHASASSIALAGGHGSPHPGVAIPGVHASPKPPNAAAAAAPHHRHPALPEVTLALHGENGLETMVNNSTLLAAALGTNHHPNAPWGAAGDSGNATPAAAPASARGSRTTASHGHPASNDATTAHTPQSVSMVMTFGFEADSLGLLLSEKEPIYPTTSSLPYDRVEKRIMMDYQAPEACRNTNPPSLSLKMYSVFSLQNLFYIFYSMPQDVLSVAAAHTLYDKGWLYHLQRRIWYCVGGRGSSGTAAPHEIEYFDTNTWSIQRVEKGSMLDGTENAALSYEVIRERISKAGDKSKSASSSTTTAANGAVAAAAPTGSSATPPTPAATAASSSPHTAGTPAAAAAAVTASAAPATSVAAATPAATVAPESV